MVCEAEPARALELARQGAGPDTLICVTGSLYLAGNLRPVISEENQSR